MHTRVNKNMHINGLVVATEGYGKNRPVKILLLPRLAKTTKRNHPGLKILDRINILLNEREREERRGERQGASSKIIILPNYEI